jgi:purine nucleosidase
VDVLFVRSTIRDTCGDVGRFLFDITVHYVDLLMSWDAGVIVVHDSSAIMAVLHPELFHGASVRVEVETKGEYTRGATVADWLDHWKRPAQTTALRKVDAERFHALYLQYVSDFAAVSFASL